MSAILKQKLIDIANGFTKYGLWKGGGSGGSSTLSEMTDVTFTDLQANDILKYNGDVSVNDDNLHEYSTEEKVVGKWIDGKPIYEITYYNETPISSSTYNNFVSTGIILNNIDNIININATVIRDYGGKLYYPIVYEDNNYKLIVRQHDINNSGNYNIEYCAFFSKNNIKNLTIIIQYTKTTD